MVRYEFELDDLARTRFAISPMWETAAAIRALRNPSLISLHLPWVKRDQARVAQGANRGRGLPHRGDRKARSREIVELELVADHLDQSK